MSAGRAEVGTKMAQYFGCSTHMSVQFYRSAVRLLKIPPPRAGSPWLGHQHRMFRHSKQRVYRFWRYSSVPICICPQRLASTMLPSFEQFCCRLRRSTTHLRRLLTRHVAGSAAGLQGVFCTHAVLYTSKLAFTPVWSCCSIIDRATAGTSQQRSNRMPS